MRDRSPALLPSFGHVEQPRTVGVVIPDAVPHDPDPRFLRPVSFADLSTPTVVRRAAEARAPRWDELAPELRAAARAGAIAALLSQEANGADPAGVAAAIETVGRLWR